MDDDRNATLTREAIARATEDVRRVATAGMTDDERARFDYAVHVCGEAFAHLMVYGTLPTEDQ
jgi:hypothetical protein